MIDNLWNGLWISKLFVPQAAWLRGIEKLLQNVRQTKLDSYSYTSFLHCIPLSLSDIAYMSGYGRIDKLPTEINAGWFQLEASYAAYSPAQPSQIISNGRFLVKLGTLLPFYISGGSINCQPA